MKSILYHKVLIEAFEIFKKKYLINFTINFSRFEETNICIVCTLNV
jgi:hypothetical protein